MNGQVSKSTQKGKRLSGNLLRTGAAAKAPPMRPAKTSRAANRLGPGNGASWPVLQPYGYALPPALQFQFQQSEWWPAERLLTQQLRQIHRLIKHAAATVPYHRDRLADLAAVPLGELTFNAFRRAPIMTRSDIQQAGRALISRSVPPHHGYVGLVRSSGSTGQPIEVATTALAAAFGLAMTMRDHLWHRRNIEEKCVEFGSPFETGKVPHDPRWGPAPDTGPLVRLDIKQPINPLFDQLIAENPGYLFCYPNTLLGIVERSAKLGIVPERLKQARTYGEAVDDRARSLLREHWGVPLIDIYSAIEIGAIAQQCPKFDHLHVQGEHVLVEILDEDGEQSKPGAIGRVVLTPLHNFASPLIRYEIGDYAEVGKPCPCGRGLAVLNRIVGRERDLIVLPDGDRFFPELQRGLPDVAAVRQYQLVQKDLDTMQFKFVVDRSLNAADRTALTAYLRHCLRYPFRIEITEVDHIPRSANGKFEVFKSEVAGASPVAGSDRP